jgi:dihydropteroate synthase
VNLKDHIHWGNRTHVMGILNVTPDSFSGDGVLKGRQCPEFIARAVSQALEFHRAGAAIIDIGGESTRPGAEPVHADTEISRVVPVIEAIVAALPDAVISIDTSKAKVAEVALQAGAVIINDVCGLQMDEALAPLAASEKCTVILMHNASRREAVGDDGAGGKRYRAGSYDHVVNDVTGALAQLADRAQTAGISPDQIILDPGIGFGKSVAQNLALLNHLDRIKALGYPVLVGPSRKSFIGSVLGLETDDRIEGTAAAVAFAIARGADIVRVHDVKTMVRVAQMSDALLRAPADGQAVSAKGAA